jgi:hypothetical protein
MTKKSLTHKLDEESKKRQEDIEMYKALGSMYQGWINKLNKSDELLKLYDNVIKSCPRCSRLVTDYDPGALTEFFGK